MKKYNHQKIQVLKPKIHLFAPICILICTYVLLYTCIYAYKGVFVFLIAFKFCSTSLFSPVRRVTHNFKDVTQNYQI